MVICVLCTGVLMVIYVLCAGVLMVIYVLCAGVLMVIFVLCAGVLMGIKVIFMCRCVDWTWIWQPCDAVWPEAAGAVQPEYGGLPPHHGPCACPRTSHIPRHDQRQPECHSVCESTPPTRSKIIKRDMCIQYSQRGTFIWTPITAIYLNVFAENEHHDRWFLPKFRVVTGVQLPTAVNTARRGVQTPRIPIAGHGGPWWLIACFIQFTYTFCRQWKTVDRDDPSRATTANPRVRSSRNARVMTTRVNGCSVAVFDRVWIILTTAVRGFMKVPRWPYCSPTSCR